ncbi:hypothetical protein B0H11DRAFT_1930752 [Mycena galericulata]|nr:hypothetical protein B0H11DRAFT_1930752 [Mycena galericulata]
MDLKNDPASKARGLLLCSNQCQFHRIGKNQYAQYAKAAHKTSVELGEAEGGCMLGPESNKHLLCRVKLLFAQQCGPPAIEPFRGGVKLWDMLQRAYMRLNLGHAQRRHLLNSERPGVRTQRSGLGAHFRKYQEAKKWDLGLRARLAGSEAQDLRFRSCAMGNMRWMSEAKTPPGSHPSRNKGLRCDKDRDATAVKQRMGSVGNPTGYNLSVVDGLLVGVESVPTATERRFAQEGVLNSSVE